MKSKVKNIGIMMCCILMALAFSMICNTTQVFADGITVDDVISQATSNGDSIVHENSAYQSILNKYYTLNSNGTTATRFTTSDSKVVYMKPGAAGSLTEAEENINRELSGSDQKATQASDGASKVENVGSEITSEFKVNADVKTGSKILSGFSGLVSAVLGILVVLISLGMTVFSACDLAYIAFPVFRNKCEDMKQSGSKLGTKTGADGETKLRFITDEAVYAVQAAETTESGKNPFTIYFSKRIISYILLAILLFILLTGRITVFTDLGVKLADGIVRIISDQSTQVVP